jgi:hypothetical protein
LLRDCALLNLFNALSKAAQPRATLLKTIGLILSPLRLPISPPGRNENKQLTAILPVHYF